MAWFQKFLGLGKKENTLLTLKLRLNRWRHFLRSEWLCNRLLDDLKEKRQGEYIFDRQYIFSTVGRIFQQAYQAAYDGTLLGQDPDGGLYHRLDQLKEETLSFLSDYPKGKTTPRGNLLSPPPGLGTITAGDRPSEEEEDLDQEPEFQMLKGAIKILDSGDGPNNTLSLKSVEEVQNLRSALRWIHEQVLNQLIKPEDVQHWVSTGLAVAWGDKNTGPGYVIDLGRETTQGNGKANKSEPQASRLISFRSWSLVQEAVTALVRDRTGESRMEPWPLFFILNENALFLFSSSSGAVILLDLVLTNVRELNHLFFRWQKGSDDAPWVPKPAPSRDWTYQEDGRVYEWAAFQRPPKEMEGYVIQLGQKLDFQ
jgi:hypothetical protein